MNLFKKLFVRNEPDGRIDELPKTYVIRPDKLTARVFLYDLETRSGRAQCLAYLTDGLQKLGQKELLLVLKNDRKAYEILVEPLQFFSDVYDYAEKERIVGHGDVTQFGERDFLGWQGIVYLDVAAAVNDSALPDCLAMILLSLDEVRAVQEFGYLRVAALLGMENAYFPHPFWSDLDRTPLPIDKITETSLVRQAGGKLNCPLASVTLENDEIILSLPGDLPSKFLPDQTVPTDIPVAILPGLSRRADGCLIIPPDGRGPAAIVDENRPGAVMGCSVLMVIAKAKSDSAKMVEDGFALMLTDQSWNEFWSSLIHRRNLVVKTGENAPDFKMIWK